MITVVVWAITWIANGRWVRPATALTEDERDGLVRYAMQVHPDSEIRVYRIGPDEPR